MDIRTEKMEESLFAALEEADAEMEAKYGDRFPLHPARPSSGTTARRQYDGLFAFDAGFSPGFGSSFGSGYALSFRIMTLQNVPQDFRDAFEKDAVSALQVQLDKYLPDRHLKIVRDIDSWKIIGDLSL